MQLATGDGLSDTAGPSLLTGDAGNLASVSLSAGSGATAAGSVAVSAGEATGASGGQPARVRRRAAAGGTLDIVAGRGQHVGWRLGGCAQWKLRGSKRLQ